MKNLMDKCREAFINCLSRDWVVNKIENIAGYDKDTIEDENAAISEANVSDPAKDGAVGGQVSQMEKKSSDEDSKLAPKTKSQKLEVSSNIEGSKKADKKVQPDATNIVPKAVYNWHGKWTFVRGRDGMYLWSDNVAVELSNGSNGWFRYILNGKLSTMYSSGSPEGGAESAGCISYYLIAQ